MNFLAELRERFANSLASLDGFTGDVAPVLELIRSSNDAKFGDYQANCAMPLGKQLGKPPREIAAALVAALDVSDLCEPPEIAGPGFINLKLTDAALVGALQAAAADTEHLGVPTVAKPRTVVVDYSSPNVAKPMHVGHIRSTVIGAAIGNVLRFLGHRVITDNHIGDWGTQFGMIIYGYKHFADEAAIAKDPVPELSRLYRLVNTLVEYHNAKNNGLPALEEKLATQQQLVDELKAVEPTGDKKADKAAAKRLRQAENSLNDLLGEQKSLEEKLAKIDDDPQLAPLATEHTNIARAVLDETAKLHSGDTTNKELWETFLPACLTAIQKTYDRLNVTFDHTLGESFYHDRLQAVVDDLVARGLATENEGAMCVFLEGHAAPFIVRKQDGAFLYSTTDLATIAYRLEKWQPDAILYVVDHRQGLHFEQLFATAKQCGCENVELMHVSFGTVLGKDGRPYKTRSGDAVGLMGLLDEAVDRARSLADASPMLKTDEERQQVAERIGIGAIKYADLAHNRTSDYKFDYDKMLAMNGNTAAYMQYSYARVRGIFEKAEVTETEALAGADQLVLGSPEERALGMMLCRFAESLDKVLEEYRPNHLTSYLFDLASSYAGFFQNCPVIKAETDSLRTSRLALCALTARTLGIGMGLLGIECVERM
ncbi:arginine--tRNA ligase [Aeoliella mucimassa]|uniref:Arginine--tRNA ligase n=1 Tax=Aeoliella mucimassa TaxID=2527972 RepID=A0A518AHP2_9BACT|nr:arginine--tRNA ligase [Aeoliella mucimassa]QDU54215.1 Arginine--tRNA ligase [Aeoliella mucimassa]